MDFLNIPVHSQHKYLVLQKAQLGFLLTAISPHCVSRRSLAIIESLLINHILGGAVLLLVHKCKFFIFVPRWGSSNRKVVPFWGGYIGEHIAFYQPAAKQLAGFARLKFALVSLIDSLPVTLGSSRCVKRNHQFPCVTNHTRRRKHCLCSSMSKSLRTLLLHSMILHHLPVRLVDDPRPPLPSKSAAMPMRQHRRTCRRSIPSESD